MSKPEDILLYVLLITCAIQVVFYLMSIIALALYKKGFTSKKQTDDGVTIVVAAYNELENLKKLVPKLIGQYHPKKEIIVIDDRSTDGSYEYLYDVSQNNQAFKLIRVDEIPGHMTAKKYALMLGIKGAKYEKILFTDADCVPVSNNWATYMSGCLEKDRNEFVLGVSQYVSQKGFLNKFIRYETLITALQYVTMGLVRWPYMGVGRNLGYTKSVFLENKGFGRYQDIIGGDDDLFVNQHARKFGARVCLDADAMILSEPKDTWKAYFIQKTRHLSVGRYYKWYDKMGLSLLTISRFLFYIASIAAILAGIKPILATVCLVVVLVLLLGSLLILRKRCGDKSEYWLFVFLELFYMFYYAITSVKVLLTKKIRWS